LDQRKIFKALEYIWIFSAALSVGITVYFLVIKDNDSALYFFFMFIISGVMFLLRRYQRKKQEQAYKDRDPKR